MKQSMPFAISMLALSILLATIAARAADGPVEVMCRNKAKEIALQTFQNCENEEKTARLKDIKERYKERMAELKNEFQGQLDELNGKKQAAAKAEAKDNNKSILPIKSDKIELGPENKSEAKAEVKPEAAADTKAQTKTAKPARAKKTARAEKPVAGIAKTLPAKQNDNGPALPMNQASDDEMAVQLVPVANVEKSEVQGSDSSQSEPFGE